MTSPSASIDLKRIPSSPSDPKEPLPMDEEKQIGIQEASSAPNANAPSAGGGGPPPPEPMSKLRFGLVFGSMMLCVFLFALDVLILSTAIPKIVSQFNSLAQVAWVNNGFFLTLAGFSLAWGQFLTIWKSKHVLLAAVFIFELGSLICGVAPSMEVLIFGRAVAGVGAAGIFSAVMQSLVEITTLQERSTYMGLFGACFGLASILGPLVGGALTDHASWRWCFYINLPIGGIAFVMLVIFLKARPPLGAAHDKRSLLTKIIQIDWVGLALAICFTTIICLALEYGGVTKAWNDPAVIALFVLIPVSLGILVAWTLWLGPQRAMLPLGLLKRRTIVGATATGFFGWMAFMAVVYWLSIAWQAVRGDSATKAGTELLSMIVVQTVLIVISGRLVAKIGRYKPLIVCGPPLIALGCGLLYWANMTTHPSYFLGFQVLLGVGVALFLQNVIIAAQTELKTDPRMIPKAIGLLNFIGFIGRVLGTGVSTSIFNNLLPLKLAQHAPGLDPQLSAIVRESVNAIRTAVPEALQPGVIEAYRVAIAPTYLYAMVAALCASITCWLIKDHSTIDPLTEKPKDNTAQPTVPAVE